jgi:LysR family transcriptional regulator, benzoate and cis,cis-muconate-responsive activator of ben and cat genes
MPVRHYSSGMDLRLMRYFQAVAEDLSFSKAARRLHVAQPALSRAVKDLEDRLGAELLRRDRRSVALTAAGAALLHDTGLLLQRLDESVRRVRRISSGEEGELRLGYIGPPTGPFLGRLLQEYRRRYPLVSVHLEERTPERVWEMVAKGRLSAGLTRPVETEKAAGLGTVALRDEPLGVAVRPDHAFAARTSVGWRALEGEPLVLLARREGMGLHDAVMSGCRAAGFSPRVAHLPSLIGTVLNYVEADEGLGVVPDSVMQQSASLRFVPLRPVVTVPLVLVWLESEDAPPVRRFRELLVEWKAAGQLWPGS